MMLSSDAFAKLVCSKWADPTSESYNPFLVAKETLSRLRKQIADSISSSQSDYLAHVSEFGHDLLEKTGQSPLVENVVFRVLRVIRTELTDNALEHLSTTTEGASSAEMEEEGVESLQNIVSRYYSESSTEGRKTPDFQAIGSAILEGMDVVENEFLDCHESISAQATNHIQDNDVIMIPASPSYRTICSFLKRASSKKRNFSLIIVDTLCPPFGERYSKIILTRELRDLAEVTIVVPLSNVLALMSRVSKVIMGAEIIYADGAIKAFQGAKILAQAAQSCSVPVIAVAGLYKLSPHFYQVGEEHALLGPGTLLKYKSERKGNETFSGISVVNSTYDTVPGNLVKLFVTDNGAVSPSYLYRIVGEYFHKEDYDPS